MKHKAVTEAFEVQLGQKSSITEMIMFQNKKIGNINNKNASAVHTTCTSNSLFLFYPVGCLDCRSKIYWDSNCHNNPIKFLPHGPLCTLSIPKKDSLDTSLWCFHSKCLATGYVTYAFFMSLKFSKNVSLKKKWCCPYASDLMGS